MRDGKGRGTGRWEQLEGRRDVKGGVRTIDGEGGGWICVFDLSTFVGVRSGSITSITVPPLSTMSLGLTREQASVM